MFLAHPWLFFEVESLHDSWNDIEVGAYFALICLGALPTLLYEAVRFFVAQDSGTSNLLRLRFQYTVRTLFELTVLISVWIAIVRWALKPFPWILAVQLSWEILYFHCRGFWFIFLVGQFVVGVMLFTGSFMLRLILFSLSTFGVVWLFIESVDDLVGGLARQERVYFLAGMVTVIAISLLPLRLSGYRLRWVNKVRLARSK